MHRLRALMARLRRPRNRPGPHPVDSCCLFGSHYSERCEDGPGGCPRLRIH